MDEAMVVMFSSFCTAAEAPPILTVSFVGSLPKP
jgi:hypothetical protein